MQPDIALRIDGKSYLSLLKQLDILALPPEKRRRFVSDIAKDVRSDGRRNIRAQKTTDGQAMEPRKAKRSRRKMLAGLGKGLAIKPRGDLHADVTWDSAVAARIAYQHQNGVPDEWTSSRARKVRGTPDYKAPATASQARSMIVAGYRRPAAKKKGKGVALKRVSQKWIRENMTMGQAGIILRMMRTGSKKGPQRWMIRIPARPFLGVPPDKVNEYLAQLAAKQLRELNT